MTKGEEARVAILKMLLKKLTKRSSESYKVLFLFHFSTLTACFCMRFLHNNTQVRINLVAMREDTASSNIFAKGVH